MLGIHKRKRRGGLSVKLAQKWAKSHHGIIASVLGIVGILASCFLVIFVLRYDPPAKAPVDMGGSNKIPPKPEAPKYYSPLTGIQVPNSESTNQAVTGIMIENSPDARPQSGLQQAGVVYEAIAEGGITRFLALYQESKPSMIGPVRSVRMYFVDWIAPFNASVAHVGGSQAALSEVRNGNYRDIDQFFNGPSYWRATDRYAPHNVYTNFDRLDALNLAKGYTKSVFAAWPRTDGKPANPPTATSIDVKISSPTYNSHYTYDPGTNAYLRYEGGQKHLDRERGSITPSVVIVLYTEMYRIMQDGSREDIRTTGSGKAFVFQNGSVTEGTWTKHDRGSQIEFTGVDGQPIHLNRGQTWITAVSTNTGGGVTWE